jgi:hypothetical protein
VSELREGKEGNMELLSHLPVPMRSRLVDLSELTGFDLDVVMLFCSCVFATLLGFVHALIPLKYVTLRHAFSLFFGLLIGWMQIGNDLVFVLICPIIVYAMVKFLPPNISPFASAVFSLAYLSYFHLYSMIFRYLTDYVDYINALMISSVNAMMFAYSYVDGLHLSQGKVSLVDFNLHFLSYFPHSFYLKIQEFIKSCLRRH